MLKLAPIGYDFLESQNAWRLPVWFCILHTMRQLVFAVIAVTIPQMDLPMTQWWYGI